MSATDVAVQKKNSKSGTTALISKEEMEDIMEIVKSLEESGLLIKGIGETSCYCIIKCNNRTRSSKSRQRSNKSRSKFLMPPHPLTNFEIQKYQNEPKFNGVYSINNLSKIKDRAYIINLYDYEEI